MTVSFVSLHQKLIISNHYQLKKIRENLVVKILATDRVKGISQYKVTQMHIIIEFPYHLPHS